MLDRQTKDGKGLSETDARNYAYAVGMTNWSKYVNLKPTEVLKTQITQTIIR